MTDSQDNAANYPFVDWIRMISMAGIVWAHVQAFEGTKNFPSLDNIPLYFFFMDFWKFGVICFFMISGFLLARKIEGSRPVDYFKRRVSGTLIPYLFAFTLVVLLFVFKTQVLHQPSSKTTGEYIVDMFLDSALWFMPNYWISLAVILCFRKYLSRPGLGLLLLGVTAIYTYSFVYSENVQSHIRALFAFIFYLWLGYYMALKNMPLYFRKINVYVLIALSLIFYVFASLESVRLYDGHSPEPMHILRLSNQIYSVLAFITMVRIFDRPLASKWFHPRKETFGIFLYHMFGILILTFLVKFLGKFGINTYSGHTITFIGWFVLKFLFMYAATLVIVKLLLKYNLGYLNYTLGGKRQRVTT